MLTGYSVGGCPRRSAVGHAARPVQSRSPASVRTSTLDGQWVNAWRLPDGLLLHPPSRRSSCLFVGFIGDNIHRRSGPAPTAYRVDDYTRSAGPGGPPVAP